MKRWLIWIAIHLPIAIAENNFNCTTHDCKKDNLEYELMILKNINSNVDPCDNFYEFACGNFDSTFFDYFQSSFDIHDSMNLRRQSIKNMILGNNWPTPFKLFNYLKDYITSCETMNFENQVFNPSIEKKRVDYLLNEVISKFGGWPVLKEFEWKDSDFHWDEFTYKAFNNGVVVSPFFTYFDRKYQNYLLMNINPPQLEFSVNSIQNLQSKSEIDFYRNFVAKVAKVLGASQHQAEELNESVDFEMKLINASRNVNLSLNSSNPHNGMSVKEIIEKWPGINWTKLLKFTPQWRFPITNASIIFITNPDYITNLEILLKETPKRVIANFAIWKVIEVFISITGSKTLFDIQQDFYKSVNLLVIQPHLNCYSSLNHAMPNILFSFYLHHYPLDKHALNKANKLIIDTRNKLVDTVKSSTKFDKKTKDVITKKINSIGFLSGFIDRVKNQTKLEEYFNNLKVTHDNFLKNFLNINAVNIDIYLSESGQPNNFIDYTINNIISSPYTINIQYIDFISAVNIGVEILTDFSFSKYRPYYTNFASVGTWVAHELGHSIDASNNQVNQYEIDENEWSKGSNENYANTERCLIEQFKNYTLKGIGEKLNGSYYLSENVADNLGIGVGYSAYQDWVRIHGPEPTFPSLPYNPNQLFWLSFANQYCRTTAYDQMVIKTKDPHTPFYNRVIGALSNIPEFSKDFNCPPGSNMNPQKKCNFF